MSSNVITPFSFALDEGIRRGLSPLAQGKQVTQELINEAWYVVTNEINNACDQHGLSLSESAVIWLAEGYFRRVIKLNLDDGTNLFEKTESKNNIELSSLPDDDISSLNRHLKGSIFEREISDERRTRK